MTQSEFTIKSRVETFRVRQMSAVEFLSLRAIASSDSIESIQRFMMELLNCIEVKLGNTWLRVYDKNADCYYPADIGDDVVAIQDLIDYFTGEVMKPVFTKSSE